MKTALDTLAAEARKEDDSSRVAVSLRRLHYHNSCKGIAADEWKCNYNGHIRDETLKVVAPFGAVQIHSDNFIRGL
jgi:hypothetical protein